MQQLRLNPEMLDLTQVDLFGWEDKKSLSKVTRFIGLLENGGTLPAISVVRIEDEGYFLDPKARPADGVVIDGGHHRAVAHYLANVPIAVLVSSYSGNVSYFPNAHIHVRDIQLSKLF